MNEAQVWTSIGLMASMLITLLTVVSTSFVRIMRAEFKTLRVEIASIDRDAQALYRCAFGGESE